jgi:uncharacterized protein
MSDAGPVVTDSGPLIALATVGQMELLAGLFGTVLVSDAVFREVAWYGARRPAPTILPPRPGLFASTWKSRRKHFWPRMSGTGEVGAIALAVQRRARLLLLDDRRARRIAEVAYHLRVKGVAGVLVAAKRRGLITSVETLLVQIRGNGYYIAQPIIAERSERRTRDRITSRDGNPVRDHEQTALFTRLDGHE